MLAVVGAPNQAATSFWTGGGSDNRGPVGVKLKFKN